REIFQTCLDGYGVGGGNMVYLDLTDQVAKIGVDAVEKKLGGILEIYRKFVGVDPIEEPMKIFPAVHYSMGGLWTKFDKDEKTGGMTTGAPENMMTSIPGLYAMGEVNVQYHGANRLGANSLLSCIFDGLFGGLGVKNYCYDATEMPAADVPEEVYTDAVAQEQARMDWLINADGTENPYKLWQEMGSSMTDNCTVVRYNDRLDKTIEEAESWKQRYGQIKLSDTGMWTNQNLSFTRAVKDMIVLAEAILKGARQRDESRGAHYKPDFPERDDSQFLKTTVADYEAPDDFKAFGGVKVGWADVDISLIPPRARTYGAVDSKPEKDEEPAEESVEEKAEESVVAAV
ncbi:MAG: FAD-binding protein, partial [Planctomycetota bacterium]